MNQGSLNEQLIKIAISFRDNLIAFIPKLILALVILLIGYLLARVVESLVKRFIRFISRLMKERFASQMKNISLDRSASFIGKVFFWIILIFFFIQVAEVLDFSDVITGWLGSILRYSPNILASILIISFGIVAGRMMAEIIASASKQMGITYGDTLGKIVQYTILLTAIVVAIDQIGVEIGFLIHLVEIIAAALLFGAGLAFGLGAKTSVSNILASFYVHKLYKIGDQIKINEVEGTIIKITGTAVVLNNADGQINIPAKEFNERRSVLVKKD